jgi:hypothetical protein
VFPSEPISAAEQRWRLWLFAQRNPDYDGAATAESTFERILRAVNTGEGFTVRNLF